MLSTFQTRLITRVAVLTLTATCGSAQAGTDQGKKACAQEAKRICPAEMRSFSRRKVEACMISKIDQTSAICHAAMLRIKTEREAAKPK
jgi:hypothetical protein